MFILILAGLFALIFGKITVTQSLALEGKYARLYGLVLLVAAWPVALFMSIILSLIFPTTLLQGPVGMALGFAIPIGIAIGFVVPFKKWQVMK